jgi:hypothetical protein
MRVNVELDHGKQAQINRLPQPKKQHIEEKPN